ncbi:MAG: orotate phosphoribosyltransferase [Longimicrobiales bacterium]|nr:orotate phosphoribosyltransferase [Longimicrobiales bacterium]
MNDRDRLMQLLVERSVRLGDFVLASGTRSDYYVDARRTTMSAEGQYLTGRVGLAAYQASGLNASHVGGLTMGADPVAYAMARESFVAGCPLEAFSVRKAAKAHGTGQRIEGGLPEGSHCLVVEDSMTTGGSALAAIEALEAYGASVVGVLTLVDREEGGRKRLEAAGYPLVAVFTGAELLARARARRPGARGVPPGGA